MNHKSNLSSYVTGFILSIVFTLLPYFAVTEHWVDGWSLTVLILVFAVIQLLVQLQFFIHLGTESKPRWNLMMFLFMMLIVGIVVIGSLWIMHNLDYNMMSHDMDEYMRKQSEKGF